MLRRRAIEWVPHQYQQNMVRFLLEHGAAGLWADPGTGKTSTTLYAFQKLLEARTARRMLVLTPLRPAYDVWPAEVAKWTQFSGLRVEILHGTKKEQALRRDADVYVINYEGLPWLLTKGRFALLDADVLCIDESTKLKHPRTQRFKMVKPMLKRFRRRWTLTGTPIPNGFMDLFGQIYCLDLGHALGPYITAYRQEYFDPTGFGGYKWELKEGAEERIYEKVRPLVLRVSNEVLDLPKLVFNDVLVTLPPEAMRAYREMEKVLVTMLNDGTAVTAVSAAAAANKLLQLTNGAIYHVNDDFIRESHKIHEAKLDAVEDLLEEIGGKPTLLLYNYDQDRAMLRKRFPWAESVAEKSAKKATELFSRWNQGQVPLMIAQWESVCHGLNLQTGGQHLIGFGVPWNLETWQQAIARLWRQGSPYDRIFIHSILAKNTIDLVVRQTLTSKDRTQRALLRAVREAYTKGFEFAPEGSVSGVVRAPFAFKKRLSLAIAT